MLVWRNELLTYVHVVRVCVGVCVWSVRFSPNVCVCCGGIALLRRVRVTEACYRLLAQWSHASCTITNAHTNAWEFSRNICFELAAAGWSNRFVLSMAVRLRFMFYDSIYPRIRVRSARCLCLFVSVVCWLECATAIACSAYTNRCVLDTQPTRLPDDDADDAHAPKMITIRGYCVDCEWWWVGWVRAEVRCGPTNGAPVCCLT